MRPVKIHALPTCLKKLACLFAAVLVMPLARADVLNPSKYARHLDFSFSGYTGTEILTDFPVLIRVSRAHNDFHYDACKVPGGGDLRFSDADGNLLSSEVERWDPDGESLVWVKVPTLTLDTVITMHYGCSNPDPVTPTDVWDAHYLGVWHLGAAAGEFTQPDSTAYNHPLAINATNSDGVACGTNGVAGLAAATGLRSDGRGCFSYSDKSWFFDGFSACTVEAWTFQNHHAVGANTADGHVLRHGGPNTTDWHLCESTNGKMVFQMKPLVGETVVPADSAPKPARAAWNHTAFAWDGSSGECAGYLNGSVLELDANSIKAAYWKGTVATNTTGFNLGNYRYDKTNGFRGSIDEVRISDIMRSPDWMKATHDTIADPSFATCDVVHDWTKYAGRFTVTFGGVPAGETLENFPVLVRLSENSPVGFHYADCVKLGGADLRFCVAGGDPLPCEVERWDPTGESLVWVKVPTLTRGTRLTAYYGWAFAPPVDAKAVWDAHYLGVWHLGAGAGESTQSDSTANAHPFAINATYPDGVACGTNGIAGFAAATGLRADGKGCFSQTDSGKFFTGLSQITVEAWTYQDHHEPDDAGISRYILAHGSNENNYDWRLRESLKGKLALQIPAFSSANVLADDAAPRPARAQWNHNVLAWDGTVNSSGQVAVYLNGDALALAETAQTRNWYGKLTSSYTGFSLGNLSYNAAGFIGSIDEVRISDIVRPAAWVKATHDTIRPGSGFATLSAAVANESETCIIIR